MGFFHEGHLALMRKGRAIADDLVVSLFVNPTQFGPGEDYETYPRDTERDLALAEETGVDAVFMPSPHEMYPEGFQTYVEQSDLPRHLCGMNRPGHFRGVMTVVAKLFNIVRPHMAVFGEKDFQQLIIIRQMVRDLNFDVEIYGESTVREADGLAMSSRNARLAPEHRKAAASLYQSLQEAKSRLAGGETRAQELTAAAAQIIRRHPEAEIDYITISDPQTLAELSAVDRPALMALAVKIGGVRLIDHIFFEPDNSHTGRPPANRASE
jgi:pantoate--beta-alanine ligase